MSSDKCPYYECDGTSMIHMRDHEPEIDFTYTTKSGNVELRTKEIIRLCRCREVKKQNRKLEFAQVPEEFKKATIQSFKIDLYDNNESQQKALAAKRIAINYVKNFKQMMDEGKGLYLCSNIKGSGKTRLAASIMNAIVRNYDKDCKGKQLTAYYTSTSRLLTSIKQTFDPNSSIKSKDIVEAVEKATVLVLDDIGVEKVSDWVEETFSRILDYRLQNKLVTIFTSNITIESLDNRYTQGRVSSRIDKMTFPVQMPDESVRKHLAKKENEILQELLLGGN